MPFKLSARMRASLQLQVSSRLLAAVADDVIGDLGAIRQAVHAGFLDGRDMDEDVLAAAVRLDEAITLGRIEPFHCPARHAALKLTAGKVDRRLLASQELPVLRAVSPQPKLRLSNNEETASSVSQNPKLDR
jgi:hypothetical protein